MLRSRRRRWFIWAVCLSLAAAAMAITPGAAIFGLVGFESSLVLAIGMAFASAHLASARVQHLREAASGSDGDSASARPARAIARLWIAATCSALALLAAPLAILSVNALRVKNCDLGGGFAWVFVLPMVTAATGSAAGVVAGLTARRRIAGSALGAAIVLASIGWGVYRFWAQPPVFGFDPFAGYFPGTLYDEEVAITGALLCARAIHLLGAAAAIAGAAALLDGAGLRLTLRVRSRRALLLFVVLGGAWLLARSLAQPVLAPDAASIARSLGARHESAHLVFLYSPSGPWAKDIALHAEEAELRWAQLADTFGVAPDGKITAWLFDSSDDKRRLLGAGHTQIAKPWRREIYLQHADWPHPVMQHELAHVFAGEFGDSIFRVSRRGLSFNVGLIEGAAVAADRRPERLTLDQQVKVMRLVGSEPPIAAVLGAGFFRFGAAQSYTVAGSFCRFLVEQRGAERFRALYRSGGDFRAVYGVELPALAGEWSRRIDQTAVSPSEIGAVRDRLTRPAVLHKVCVHELAVRREAARRAQGRGEIDRALALLESICRDDPDEPEHLALIMDTLASTGRQEEALAAAARLLAHPKIGDGLRARALTLRGDDALRRDDLIAAERDYAAAAALPLDEGTLRQLRARRIAARGGAFGKLLGQYLVGDAPGPRDGAIDLYRAAQIAQLAPERALGHYLLGRQLSGHDRFVEAADALAAARAIWQRDPPAEAERGFQIEALRLEAIARFRAGRRDEAAARFAELAAASDPLAAREAADWLARCRFAPPH